MERKLSTQLKIYRKKTCVGVGGREGGRGASLTLILIMQAVGRKHSSSYCCCTSVTRRGKIWAATEEELCSLFWEERQSYSLTELHQKPGTETITDGGSP